MTGGAPGAKRPKVIRVIARLNIGGPARHVILLNEGLEQRGFDTLLVHGSLGKGEAGLDHVVAERRLPVVKIPELGPGIRLFDDARALWKLIRLVFRERPDVVHTHTAKAGALGRLAAFTFNLTKPRDSRCVIVHTFHGHVLTGYFSAPTNALVKWAEWILARATDRIITISPGQRRDLVDTFGVAPDARTTVVPLGLSLEAFLQSSGTPGLRNELGIGARDFVIGFVGRFVPIKDLTTLVHAFAVLIRQAPDSWLVIAGDGPARASVESLITELGVSHHVKFLGWTEHLPAVYATMDVCALSSVNEGTPVAIIEAMAAGKAVVATSVGGVPDLVEHEVTGLLVPPRAIGALAAAMIRLAANPDERTRLGGEGRRRAADRYRHTRLVSDVARLYLGDLAEKRR